MSEYLLINIGIIIIPFLLSFEKKISYYKKLPYLFYSILVVSTIYIVWDVIAAGRGDWSFNPAYTTGLNLFGLPIEELFFFITVPYSIIFIYETLLLYLNDKQLNFNRYIFFAAGVVLISAAFFFLDQNSTFIVMIYCGIFFLLSPYVNRILVTSKIFWITILISFIPFLIVNYILTSLPIVTYSDEAIWGERFITIPLEDFFYSFSMIAYWLLFYHLFRSRLSGDG
jgi:lycopene cyclase domain-containing protein